MKFNLSHQLLGLDGQPATQTIANGFDMKTGQPLGFKEEPLTVGMVLKTALNFQDKEEKMSLEDAVKRGKWIMSINKDASPDFKVEDQALIKKLCLSAGFAPIVIVQIDELIENKGS